MGFFRRLIGKQERVEPPSDAVTEPPRVAVPVEAPPDGAPCPHCGVILTPIPKGRRLCPACRQPIIPRSRADRARVVLREEDLPAFDAWNEAWRKEERAISERRRWLARARELSIAEPEFVAIESELKAKDARYTDRDVYHAAANQAIIAMMRRGDWGDLSHAYSSLALVEYDEGDKDQASEHVLELLRESAKATLRDYQRELRRVQILPCACAVCSRSPKRALLIPDELAAPHIPHLACREGLCSCLYLPVVDREAGLGDLRGRRPRAR